MMQTVLNNVAGA